MNKITHEFLETIGKAKSLNTKEEVIAAVKTIDTTLLQHHWAGKGRRGTAFQRFGKKKWGNDLHIKGNYHNH